MKRIRAFRVEVLSGGAPDCHEFKGWHKAWDFAAERLKDDGFESRIYDSQRKSSEVIAYFSREKLELSDRTSRNFKTRWQSENIESALGERLFANYNMTDFGWDWIDGASHDLPFQLGYIEREAGRHPNGFLAFLLGLRNQALDMFGRT